jgi:peroxiredoxin
VFWLAIQSDAVRPQLRAFIAWLVLLLANTASTQVLPKPQVASAQGKPAPDFTLKDQDGRPFHLASLRGKRVLLVFYRGYWWPYCTGQLREFARHKENFDSLNTRVVAISVDDREHARLVWEKVVDRQFTILSDPAAQVIRTYGLLHSSAGKEGEDIALDTTLLVDADGREGWRRVSATLPDIPSAEEILGRIRKSAANSRSR